MRHLSFLLALAVLCGGPAVLPPAAAGPVAATPFEIHLSLDPGSFTRHHTPLTVTLPLPDDLRNAPGVSAAVFDEANQHASEPVQAVVRDGQVTVYWAETALYGGALTRRILRLARADSPSSTEMTDGFHFVAAADHRDLIYGDQPVWRRSFGFDPSHREETLRPYLLLNGFHDEGFVTKGLGGLYPHQRGLFLGWSRTGFAGKTYDFWSCNDVVQRQTGFVSERDLAGALVARDASTTEWLTGDGRLVLRDTREFMVWRLNGSEVFLDTTLTLAAASGPVALSGDPHHGGWQLRAANEVRDHATETYFFRSPGAHFVHPDVWDQTEWVAMNFRLGTHTYTVTDMSHPANPGVTRFALRDYGRLGTYFDGVLEVDHPWVIHNRFLLQEATVPGEITVASQAERYRDFATPVAIKIDPAPPSVPLP